MNRDEVLALLGALERGEVRAAAPDASGTWLPNAAVKEGILLAFRLGVDQESGDGIFRFRDRDTLPPRSLPDGVRVGCVEVEEEPGCVARYVPPRGRRHGPAAR